MKKRCYFHTLFSTLFFAIFIVSDVHAQTVTYTASTEDIVNPDRGFYHPIHTHTSSFTPLNLSELQSRRMNPFTPFEGNYMVRTSLIFRHYVMDSFVGTDDLSATFLNNLQADMSTARQAGVRLIIRFSYTTSPNTSCGSSACPPYGDAPKSRILAHISQIKPYLQNNEDVIAAVQQGFIGVWGEQYYTDYFGDASLNGQGKIYDVNWLDRNEVLAAMLDAVPSSRVVQVRYPQLKQRYLGGVNTPVTFAAMTAAEAHNGSDIARIAFHNDCFLASFDDYGTYWDYGNGDANSGTSPSEQVAHLKPYAAADSKYTGIGGETCDDGNFDPENNCDGQALTDMALLHYSFLNSDYNNQVNNDWQDGGCIEDIKQKLGYRLVLQNGTYPATAAAGTTIDFTINLENVGWVAPFNERTLQIVLRNTGTNEEYELPISGTNTDSRFWHSGSVSVEGSITVPSNISNGDYRWFLQIFDSSNNNMVADRPEYCIQLANTNTWEAATGYNDLQHTMEITEGSESCQIGINGEFGDWSAIATITTMGSGGLTELKAVDDANFIYLYAGTTTDANYQFYLDTDNNASGSNEFVASHWSGTGMNYLIENGLLYEYIGSGSDFSWNQIATLEAVKTASGVELVLDKTALTDLAATVNIAYSNLNSDYDIVGFIPTATNAAAYNLANLIDCACGEADLMLSGGIMNTQVYETNGRIESTQVISGDVAVTYDAAVSVLLDVGFSVGNGAVLEVFIDGCNENGFSNIHNFQRETLDNQVLSNVPTSSMEMAIFPNPVSHILSLTYEIPKPGSSSLTVFNALGTNVWSSSQQISQTVGQNTLEIHVQALPKGIYVLVLESGEDFVIKKFVKE